MALLRWVLAAFLTAVMVALLLPQISLSLLGGWLNGRYDARVAIPWPTVTQDRDETASVPDGRAANHPLRVTTFRPSIGAPFPGARAEAWRRIADVG